jgi:hypothetical protein
MNQQIATASASLLRRSCLLESLSEQGVQGAEQSYVLDDHENHDARNYRSGQCQVPQEIEGQSMSGEKNDYRRNHGLRARKEEAKYVHDVGPLMEDSQQGAVAST